MIGILGGTFDPPHRGHLALGLAAMRAASLERVLLIPDRIPPHKRRADLSAPEHRLAMARLLAEESPSLEASDIELRREGPSYTIDTVRALVRSGGASGYRLILGADMAMEFGSWREAEDLIRLAPPLVALRPGVRMPDDLGATDIPGLSAQALQLIQAGRFDMPLCDISSTRIRAAVGRGEDVLAWVTPKVADYIRTQGLYRQSDRPVRLPGDARC